MFFAGAMPTQSCSVYMQNAQLSLKILSESPPFLPAWLPFLVVGSNCFKLVILRVYQGASMQQVFPIGPSVSNYLPTPTGWVWNPTDQHLPRLAVGLSLTLLYLSE